MSKIPKFLKIGSLSKDDSTALFNAICEDILKMSTRKAKKDVLKLDGTNKELDEYMPNILNVITLIEHYEIKVELKVMWADLVTEQKILPKEQVEATKKEIAKQNEEIQSAEMKPKEVVVEIKKEVKTVPSVDPPDFD